jgi:hypothetical protein
MIGTNGQGIFLTVTDNGIPRPAKKAESTWEEPKGVCRISIAAGLFAQSV